MSIRWDMVYDCAGRCKKGIDNMLVIGRRWVEGNLFIGGVIPERCFEERAWIEGWGYWNRTD